MPKTSLHVAIFLGKRNQTFLSTAFQKCDRLIKVNLCFVAAVTITSNDNHNAYLVVVTTFLLLITLYKTTLCLSDLIQISFAMPLTTPADTPTRLSQQSVGGT